MPTVPGQACAPTLSSLVPGVIQLVAWSPPADDGGLPITRYDASYRTGAAAYVIILNVNEGDYITSLTQGATYDVRLRAFNALGVGLWSIASEATVATAEVIVGLDLNLRYDWAEPDVPADLLMTRQFLNEGWINDDLYVADALSVIPANAVAITDANGRTVPVVLRLGELLIQTADGPRALPVPQFGVWRLELVGGLPAWVRQE